MPLLWPGSIWSMWNSRLSVHRSRSRAAQQADTAGRANALEGGLDDGGIDWCPGSSPPIRAARRDPYSARVRSMPANRTIAPIPESSARAIRGAPASSAKVRAAFMGPIVCEAGRTDADFKDVENAQTMGTSHIFKIGIGPSSSHTMGPMNAARTFAELLAHRGLLERTTQVSAQLYGSLALTGRGALYDRAVLLGLEGLSRTPSIPPSSSPPSSAFARPAVSACWGGTRSTSMNRSTCCSTSTRLLPGPQQRHAIYRARCGARRAGARGVLQRRRRLHRASRRRSRHRSGARERPTNSIPEPVCSNTDAPGARNPRLMLARERTGTAMPRYAPSSCASGR